MLKLAWLVPLLVIAGCVPSQSQWQREQEYQKASRAAASSADDKTRAKYTTMANQLEAAANSTKVSGNSLTTNKAVDSYSKDIDVLLDRIATVENDPALQSPRSWLWPYVEPSLKYARGQSSFLMKTGQTIKRGRLSATSLRYTS